MYHPSIIQIIAEDHLRELHRKAEHDRDARLARQRGRRLPRGTETRAPIALRVLPPSIRPRFT
jgi:hypothetical protein